MHRSGTSAVAGALSCLAVDFGEQLTPGTEDNSKGYWEHTEIVALHDELLRGLHSRWDDDKSLPAGWLDRDVTTEIESLLIGIIKRDFDHAPLFGLKDPRMCRLVPLWLRIFKRLEIDPYFILPIRHPFEVAQSLAKRDGMDHAKSYLLWLNHLVEAESATRAEKRSFVCYGDFVTDPIGTLSTAQKTLGLDFRSPTEISATLRKFVEPKLRHHDSGEKSTLASKVEVPALALEIFNTLCSSAGQAEVSNKIKMLTTQFVLAGELFYPRIGLLQGELAALDSRVPSTDDTSSPEQLVRLDIFHPTSGGYRSSESQIRFFGSGSWKTLAIDLPGRVKNSEVLRLDPVSYPAVVDIAELVLKQAVSGEVVWRASNPGEFDAFQVAGTGCRLENDRYLRIFSFGGDPQLLFPAATASLGTSPLRLELSIRVDGTTEAIRSAVADQASGAGELAGALESSKETIRRQAEELQAAADVASQLEAAKARLALLDMAAGSWQRTVSDLQLALDGSRAELTRVTYHAEASNAQVTSLRAEVEKARQQAEATNIEIAALRAEGESAKQRTQVADVEINNLGLEVESAKQEVRDVTSRLEAATAGLEDTRSQLEAAQTRAISLETAAINERARTADLQASLEAAQQSLRKAIEERTVTNGRVHTLETALQETNAEAERLRREVMEERRNGRDNLQQIEALRAAMEQARLDSARSTIAVKEQISKNRELRAQLENKTSALAGLDEQIATLKVGLEAARSQWNEVSGELRGAALEISELQNERQVGNEQIRILEQQVQEMRLAFEKSDVERQRLAAAVEIHQANKFGFEKYRTFVEQQLQVIGQGLSVMTQRLLKGDGDAPSLVDLISRNIRRIAHPSAAWRTAGAVGLLRAAPAGAPKTVRESASVASDLQAGLDEICQSLASAKQAPATAAAEIPRLFELQRRTQELVRSMALPHLGAGNKSLWNIVHWARPTRTNVPIPAAASRLFDAAWYLSNYPDVANAELDPLQHYWSFGVFEGRHPNAVFNVPWYLEKHPELDLNRTNPLEHYWNSWETEGSDPSPLFDSRWYSALYKDVSGAGLNPLHHYLRYGMAEDRHPHPLFDAVWYRSNNPETAGLNPVEHYLKQGGRLGLSPHPLFNGEWYLKQNTDVAEHGDNPLVHYLLYGVGEGRNPHPLFDARWYLHEVGYVSEAVANPLLHYLTIGAQRRLSPSPFFDPEFYLAQDPGLAECTDFLLHYLTVGWKHGCQPSPDFDPKRYLALHPEARDAGIDPLTYSLLRP
ncbi:MAG TPA: hypothetical protein VGW57_13200 [Chthoniobacterales bacterium]|nr:hypothetical protein [Chthoniobacterales bacterium]